MVDLAQSIWPEEDDPVPRKVALKVIKRGMHSAEVQAKFAMERQILALLHHPSIATILDAGELSNGEPYFAMEWINGVPITDYCDEHRLTVAQRLEIFDDLCQAIHHAHQKGVIHRDLKPSNILVSTSGDGRPLVKVIDFGIAKALAIQGEESGHNVDSTADRQIGTLQYMSPEQARGDLDIDVRADVYSLGVIFYELLTGSTPVTKDEAQTGEYLDILKKIRLVDPPKPSARLRGLGDDINTVAELHSTRPNSLSKSLRGEIDWIVMKALEKERGRRYDSVRALANDVERYQKGEPLTVGPPTGFYQTRKFLARHKLAFASGLVVFLAIITGTIVSLWQYGKERKALDQESALSQLLRRELDVRDEFLQQSELISLQLASSLSPALMEHGRLDLLGGVTDKVKNRAEPILRVDENQWIHQARIEEARAWSYWRRDDREEALAAAERLMSLLESSREYSQGQEFREQEFRLAVLFDELGERQAAIRHCERVLEQGASATNGVGSLSLHPRLRAYAKAAKWRLVDDRAAAQSLLDRAGLEAQGAEKTDEMKIALAELRMTKAALLWEDDRSFEAGVEARQAIDSLQALVRKSPRNAAVKQQLAEALDLRAEQSCSRARIFFEFEVAAADWKESARLIGELVDLDPGNKPLSRFSVSLWRKLGNAWSEAGQYTKAHEAYNEAISYTNEKRSLAAYEIQLDQAMTDLLAQPPNLDSAKRRLAALGTAVMDEKASAEEKSAWQFAGGRYQELLAEIAVTEERDQDALQHLRKAIASAELGAKNGGAKLGPDSLGAGLHEKHAEICAKVNESERALKSAKEALTLRVALAEEDPNSVEAIKDVARAELLMAALLETDERAEALGHVRKAWSKLSYLRSELHYINQETGQLYRDAHKLLTDLDSEASPLEKLKSNLAERVVAEREKNPVFARVFKMSQQGQHKILAQKYKEAEALLTDAAELLKPLCDPAEKPSLAVRNEWAFLCTRTGRLHRTRGKPEEALPWCEEAILERSRLWEESGEMAIGSELMVDRIEQALALRALNRFREAEAVLVDAIDVQKELLAEQGAPGNGRLLENLGNACFFLGSIRAKRFDLEGAETACLRAAEIRRELYWRTGAVLKARWVDDLTQSLDGLAQVHARMGRLPEAAEGWESAIALQERLVRWRMEESGGKTRTRYVVKLVDFHRRLGSVQLQRNQIEQAVENFNKGIEWAEKFAHDGALASLFYALAKTQCGLGEALLVGNDFERTDKVLKQCAAILENHEFTSVAPICALNRARLAWENGNTKQAEELIVAVAKLTGEKGLVHARALTLLAAIQWENDSGKRAFELVKDAEALLLGLCQADGRYTYLAALARARSDGARYARAHGDRELSKRWLDASEAFWKKQLENDPEHGEARRALAAIKRYHLQIGQNAKQLGAGFKSSLSKNFRGGDPSWEGMESSAKEEGSWAIGPAFETREQ